MMQIHETFLLDYETVQKLGGTNYIEICQGDYVGHCWQKSSVYIVHFIWEDFLDTLATEYIPNYDFFDFFYIKQSNSLIFAEKLLQLANLLQAVQTPNDFDKPEWYSNKVGRPYIRIGDNIQTFLLNNKDEYQQQFYDEFPRTIQRIENTYRDLATWLQQHSQRGNAFLGM